MKYLEGPKIKLCKFTERAIIPEYIAWLNDSEVNKFLEVGRFPITTSEVFAPKDEKNFMFMVMANFYIGDIDGRECMEQDYSKYIGTCSLHKIDWITRKGEIGYMIGNKQYWGHGVATEVIELLTNYAFNKLNLNKIIAGVVGGNIGSTKALERNGYKQFANFEQDHFIDGKFVDTYKFHKFQEWHNPKKEV